MTRLLMIREQIKNFVNNHDTFVYPVLKAILAIISLAMINGAVGYVGLFKNPFVVIILGLISSFLPMNFIVVLDALVMLLHLYALSIECVIVVACILFIMFLLYFRFSPKDTILLILTPLCHIMGIPYVTVLSAGLVSGVGSAVTIGCGSLLYYVLDYINKNAELLKGGDSDTMIARFRAVLDAVIKNKEMMVLVVAFVITIIVVNIIRRLPVDHAWTIAIVAGSLVDIVVVLAGDLKFGTYISIPGLILGSVVAVLVTIVIKFFLFNVDYGRTEHVSFEDDEYVYYVKAVPKNNVSMPEKKVKTIRASEEEDEDEPKNDAREYTMKRSNSSGGSNRSATKRIILPADSSSALSVKHTSGRTGRTDANGLTPLEREAAQKAREARKGSGRS